MTRIHATFDGHVLRPDEASSLEPNKRYVLTVEPDEEGDAPSEHVLTRLAALATDMGVTDLAENHDKYARNRHNR